MIMTEVETIQLLEPSEYETYHPESDTYLLTGEQGKSYIEEHGLANPLHPEVPDTRKDVVMVGELALSTHAVRRTEFVLSSGVSITAAGKTGKKRTPIRRDIVTSIGGKIVKQSDMVPVPITYSILQAAIKNPVAVLLERERGVCVYLGPIHSSGSVIAIPVSLETGILITAMPYRRSRFPFGSEKFDNLYEYSKTEVSTQ